MKKLFYIVLPLLVIACETSPGEQAEVSEAKEVKIPEPKEVANIVRFQLRPSASEISWTGSKPTGKHHGTFGIESGYFDVLNDKLSGGKVIIDMNEIEVSDLKSDEDSHMKLTEHLKSDDFFDVANHPHAEFEVTDIASYDSIAKTEQEAYEQNNLNENKEFELKNPTHKITGNLTLRDTTLSITFPAYVLFNEEQLVAKAKFKIDRTKWNVKYNEEANFADKAQDQLIYNEVVVRFDIVANPEKEVL